MPCKRSSAVPISFGVGFQFLGHAVSLRQLRHDQLHAVSCRFVNLSAILSYAHPAIGRSLFAQSASSQNIAEHFLFAHFTFDFRLNPRFKIAARINDRLFGALVEKLQYFILAQNERRLCGFRKKGNRSPFRKIENVPPLEKKKSIPIQKTVLRRSPPIRRTYGQEQ